MIEGVQWTYSPRTGKSASYVNPIDDVQLVRAVASRDGVAYLGGDHAAKEGPRATVIAVDPATGKQRWCVDTEQAAHVAALGGSGPEPLRPHHQGRAVRHRSEGQERGAHRRRQQCCAGFAARGHQPGRGLRRLGHHTLPSPSEDGVAMSLVSLRRDDSRRLAAKRVRYRGEVVSGRTFRLRC